MKHIARSQALDWMLRNRENPAVKVVSGIRGSGKSSLFRDFASSPALSASDRASLIHIDLDSPESRPMLEEGALESAVKSRISSGSGKPCLLIDEIQTLPRFGSVLDRLADMGCSVYVNASCAWNGPEQITALFAGRHIRYDLLPLSFAEFHQAAEERTPGISAEESFTRYLCLGSLPSMLGHADDADGGRGHMRLLFSSAMYSDVLLRSGLTDAAVLEDIARCMAASLGSPLSPASLAQQLTARGRKIDPKTADRYLWAFAGSLIMQPVQRFNLRSGDVLSTRCKYYATEPAMLPLLQGFGGPSRRAVLENIVFLELLRRGYEVFAGQIGRSAEFSFVAMKGAQTEHIQVAPSAPDAAGLAALCAPLTAAGGSSTVLTLDEDGPAPEDRRIVRRALITWLLEEA